LLPNSGDLQQLAVEGLDAKPGSYRIVSLGINRSDRVSLEPHLVGGLMIKMCDYVNENLHEKSAFHLAAYVMWRHNWVHPQVLAVLPAKLMLCAMTCLLLFLSAATRASLNHNRR